MNDNNGTSTNNGSDNGSFSCGTNGTNLVASTPVVTPEPKSVSIPSGSRSEIHYPGVQNPSRIYESKKNRKIVRIMTVLAYMFAVSLAAIVLSLYYVFLWNPNMQIHNSTNSKIINLNPNTEVPLLTHSNSNQNQVTKNIRTNEQPFIPSVQVLTLNRTEPTVSTVSTLKSRIPSTVTNVKIESYSANIVLPKAISSVYHKRDNIFELVAQTNSINAFSAVDTDKSIKNHKHNSIETNNTENVTSIVKFNETNQFDLKHEKEIEISVNSTKNETQTTTNNYDDR
jgi:hypothetical protein